MITFGRYPQTTTHCNTQILVFIQEKKDNSRDKKDDSREQRFSSQLPAPQIAPQVVLPSRHSRLNFAHSTRTISAEGCAGHTQIALSPAFRALDAHDLRRGLRRTGSNRTLACISRTRQARSPQRAARDRDKSHSRLHFAHSTRTISAEGCPRPGQIALSPAFRALDTHDLRRGLPAAETNRTLTCISRTRRARSPQRVARGRDKSHSHLHFAHSTRTIFAEGCVSWRSGGTAPGLKRES